MGMMTLTRGFVNISRCNSCRLAVLKTFVSAVHAPSLSDPPLTRFRDSRVLLGIQRRPFSKSQTALSNYVPQVSVSREDAQCVPEDGQSTAGGEDGSPSSASPTGAVPWYLQVETPRRVPQSISNRQRIPDLPAGSPPFLQPLLEHISVDLGLDDLTIVDLRNLDPPPALGANLLMVLGTARSEKHLHVSADRLCRWLRSGYNLTPFADGLLGRNELKLKLKRKARRSKLLGSVGASERDGMGDGVRTGWICVNVGRIEAGDNGVGEVAAADRFVGFGSRSQGVRLVVQMLTEEKREELDLEGLWGGILDRKARRDAKTMELAERVTEDRTAERHADTSAREISNVSSNQISRSQLPAAHSQALQTRSLHTSTRHFTDRRSIRASTIPRNNVPTALRPNEDPLSGSTLDGSIMLSLMSAVDAGNYRSVSRILCSVDPLALRESIGDGGKELLLRAHLNHLRSLPRGKALELLGGSPSNRLSSPFLFSFYQTLPAFPNQQHWQCLAELLCKGLELSHRRYTKSNLMALFSQLCLSGVDIPMRTFLTILQGLLVKNGISPSYDGDRGWTSDVLMVMNVLEEMRLRGHDILTEDIFVLLLEAVNRPGADEVISAMTTSRQRLSDVIFAYDIPIVKQESLLLLLPIYAHRGDWHNFWSLWKGIAFRALRRTEALYALMFRTIAETSNRVQCMRALRTGVSDMEIEEPPVELTGDVALAVRECLAVVAPDVSGDALADGEWARLWRRCKHDPRQCTH
ncbi:hypothetical protein FGG08_000119 [Glutinoglossum americanum]|uniref:ATPase synthesis protein 25 n=1 Tax=Glutinoglossum americanum TaxID=1670608 RepID=A0A9P8IFU9_9PEZI|nr:hypothetical protein FGG08_000119 [Glutinoglossum americanum]